MRNSLIEDLTRMSSYKKLPFIQEREREYRQVDEQAEEPSRGYSLRLAMIGNPVRHADK